MSGGDSLDRLRIIGHVASPGRGRELREIVVEDGSIAAVRPWKAQGKQAQGPILRLDATDTLIPGFIDLQVNGLRGVEASNHPEDIMAIARLLPRYGVTACLPTVISASPADISAKLRAVKEACLSSQEAQILGVHVEGPFLSPKRKGAHPIGQLRLPTLDEINLYLDSGVVRMMTLAPELPGSLDLIPELVREGVTVSIGHSDASFEEASMAIDVGVRAATHIFNGMRPLDHRDPGALLALLLDNRVAASIIVDGIHLDPSIVRLVVKLKTCHNTFLITDSTAASGMPSGRYQLGEQTIISDGKRIELLGRESLAGSSLTMDQALRNMIRYTGCSLEDAVTMASHVPARLIGYGESKGRIAPGFDADLVVLDAELMVVLTLVSAMPKYIGAKYSYMFNDWHRQ